MDFGEKVRFLRESARLTQEELAEMMGIQRNTIWRWENQRANPNKNAMSRLASALNTTVAYLTGETDAPDRPAPMERQAEPEPVKLETQTRDRGELFFRFPDGGELRLPDTPENKALFEKMVAQRLTVASASQPV